MEPYWNPFDSFRDELTTDSIIEYFVEPDSLPHIISSRTPLVIIGGRGTGKTSLLKYLSYYIQKQIYNDFINDSEFIGIYWKVNTNYVNAFKENGLLEDTWIRLFSHYLNIIFCQEICSVLIDMKNNNLYNFTLENKICKSIIYDVFYDDYDNIKIYEELSDYLNSKRNEIEKYINNINREKQPLLSLVQKGYVTFCNEIIKEIGFNGKWFIFLIDEYENLLEYQQKIINTFIKHAQYPCTFRICRRPKGDKTYQTLSESEIMSDPADWEVIQLMDSIESMEDKSRYIKFVKRVCKKRLEKSQILIEKDYTDIEKYLPGISIKEESIAIGKTKDTLPYINELKNKIREQESNKEKAELILKSIIENNNPIIKRLILSLLDRGKKLNYVYQEYVKYQNNIPSKFKDGQWIHNNELGILYLLCHEYQIQKKYCGFDIFINLSSGIIRYFLELCSVSFRFAIRQGYNFEDPAPLSIDIQTKAARYVAHKRFTEISKYKPYGQIIKEFAATLGNIFGYYHKLSKQSEPEKNQFTTDYVSLSMDSQDIMNKALMYSVLLEFPSSKKKSDTEVITSDYMLHPIYSPYLNISYTKGRKINIAHNYIETLFHGNLKEKERIIKIIIKERNENQITIYDILEDLS